jgi:hypothetical protein
MSKICPNDFRCARFIFALFAAIIVTSALNAQQPPARNYDNRVLLVFDTSRDMKQRLPKTQMAANQFLFGMIRGDLRDGDTIGTWTFANSATAGKFSLQTWKLSSAATIASNLTTFAAEQHYGGSTHFDPLMSLIPDIVRESDRLTIAIFCDGDGEIKGTPFDAPINGLFKQKRTEAKKAGQPFVIILRTQLGRYVGCRVNVPPEMDFPVFPPFPAPPVPLFSATTTSNRPAPILTAPPLIIIGKNVMTNLSPAELKAALANQAVVLVTNVTTNLPPMIETNVPQLPTNPAPATTNLNVSESVSTNAPRTNLAAGVITNLAKPIQTNVPDISTETMKTNIVPTIEDSSDGDKHFAWLGVGFLAAAFVLGIFLWRRSHKKDSESLITGSMNKK